MLRKTYSILAVALTVSACGGTAAAQAAGGHEATKRELAEELSNTTLQDAVNRGDHFSPLCDAAGYPLPGNINNKGAHAPTAAEFCNAIGKGEPTKPAPTTSPTPTPAPTTPAPAACDKNALNQELSNRPLDGALADHAKYRCLCDDKGYPLVGNINSKGTTASAFCSALKEKGLL